MNVKCQQHSWEFIKNEQKKLLNNKEAGSGQQMGDQYQELTTCEDIRKFLNYVLFNNQEPSFDLNDIIEKLTPFISLQTTRTSYLYGDEFKIDLD
ncbi:hypothetical protein FDP41_009314 [Naegleria fowleri]|uniref:Uncharacterized protein n=1 Tax=Naegleria fowleri TaxID=5763 RepID=A0A6A5BCL7_NAEFO|nr:uncharacterized protein FDP41_009314 [Naegleria fowleri]KAF0972411.1 hypothetical protein FDP41_009314 [Naegleria fowleri]CAG4713399.1 unnamed protein product [Naegleria fowleri]